MDTASTVRKWHAGTIRQPERDSRQVFAPSYSASIATVRGNTYVSGMVNVVVHGSVLVLPLLGFAGEGDWS